MKRTLWEQSGRYLLPVYFVGVLLYLLLPLLLVVPMSVSETRYLKFPPTGFTLHWYEDFFATPGWIDATWRSLVIAAASALLATVVGTAAALVLSRDGRAVRIAGPIFLGPQVVPVIILALGTLLVFSRFGLYGSMGGIVLVHAVLALPFVTTTVSGALRQTGDTLARAARVLGARPHEAFWHVTLPTIRPAVISAGVFAFFISFDELVIALFVMGRNETLPMRIWADMRHDLTPVVAAVASLLILATFAAVFLSDRIQRRAERRAG
ncbi:ABC transporter permease [Azospirillum brasilense]|uniref:ABC transporter permease n=1 Tax=Azospirillum brasilense TaxID=192 RepID=A0A6L3AZ70_AZOBR|nr:ABC transporter permease [Azospirillum brasilense]KAA0685007.1 ABC transporter permease [Azospirillum brasilense]